MKSKNVSKVIKTIQPISWWRRWWKRQGAAKQDRFASLAPIASVVLFFAAIVISFWYLRIEEIDREQEAVRRDVEYSQQRLRLKLLERQEQVMRLARDISNNDVDTKEFGRRDRFNIPVPDSELSKVTFYKPADDTPEMKYLHERRQALGGYLPHRRTKADESFTVPALSSL